MTSPRTGETDRVLLHMKLHDHARDTESGRLGSKASFLFQYAPGTRISCEFELNGKAVVTELRYCNEQERSEIIQAIMRDPVSLLTATVGALGRRPN